ncbi:hypothetical protein [Edaphovirga cremea]|uniref:hypothetical protein n=1 Tax=Edaphovirga cremea TaxID=2267246 RepID=UPI001475D56A|nr:hypothetical protein [Edaphovirga cremea]
MNMLDQHGLLIGLMVLALPLYAAASPGVIQNEEGTPAAARDPFRPLSHLPCAVAPELLGNGIFKGQIGDARGMTAWIVDPAGQWHKLIPGGLIGDSGWYVAQIAPRKIDFSNDHPTCAASPPSVSLLLP